MDLSIGEKYIIKDGLDLEATTNGLMLTDGERSMIADFVPEMKRLNKANLQHEMLIKAAKLKGMTEPGVVLDATAGLGNDSLLLAAAGFTVKMYEQDPVIAALLKDALRRAACEPKLLSIVARMEVFEEDSIAAMKKLDYHPDVIFLDPMFPERQKSALVKKKFQLLQQLERPCSDEEELFEAAVAAAPRKIVVKRPVKGPYLAGRKPDYSLEGKAIRYDCFVNIACK